MAKLVKGNRTVETKVPTAILELKSQGYKVVEADKPAPKPEIKK